MTQSQFRSGSMSSGINSSHFDLTDDSSFNFFQQQQQRMHSRPNHMMGQRGAANQLGQRNMSTSVFNLNHLPGKMAPPQSNGWGPSSMQQVSAITFEL